MPIHEYACLGCGKPFELLVRRASDKPSCPHCASRKVSKRFSTFGVSVGGASARGESPLFEGDCGASYCRPGGCRNQD